MKRGTIGHTYTQRVLDVTMTPGTNQLVLLDKRKEFNGSHGLRKNALVRQRNSGHMVVTPEYVGGCERAQDPCTETPR